MREVLSSMTFAFSKVFSWHTMKFALISGALIFLFWIGVGYLIWDYLVAISAKIVEFVPFNMIRSNGAWMLSSFLWFILTLITFAIIFAFVANFLLQKGDRKNYGKYYISILAVSAIFWSIIWFFFGDYIYHQFLKLLTWLPFETIEKGVAYLIGFYIIYNAIIISILVVASLFSEPLIKSISNEEIVSKHIFSSTKYTIKDAIIYFLLSLLAFPLIFIPILNIVVQVALWIWLIKDTISFDALSLTSKELDKTLLKEHRSAIWLIAAVTAIFNFIPIFNIFGPYFGEISSFKYFKEVV